MTPLVLTLLILSFTLLAMGWGLFRLDIIALLMLLALGLSGLLTQAEVLAGFSDSIVIMLAALFVVGRAIHKSGLAHLLARGLLHLTGTRELPLMVGLVLAVAFLSAFMSSTGTMSIFLPIAVTLAEKAQLHPGRLLMPMAFAAFVGGMLTLIGTPPNLVVANALTAAQLPSFGFFSFTLPGLAALLVLLLYFVFPGRWLLPNLPPARQESADSPSLPQLIEDYQLEKQLCWVRLPAEGPLLGLPLQQLKLPAGLQLLCVQESKGLQRLHFCHQQTCLVPEGLLLLQGEPALMETFIARYQLASVDVSTVYDFFAAHKLGLAEVMILPRSSIVGKTLAEVHFRNRFHLHILGVVRQGKLLPGPLSEIALRFADVLLLQGPWRRIAALQNSPQMILLKGPAHEPHFSRLKMGLTAAWVALMLLLLGLSAWPMTLVVILTAAGLVLSRCLTMEEAYRSISWETVILVAAMLPMATALEKVGLLSRLATLLSTHLGSFGPTVVMATLFALTSGLSLLLSNTATTVLMTPIALQLAKLLGATPQSFLMVVALAASAAFASPLASPVNTMVISQGNYRFRDFVIVGLPLQLLLLLLSIWLVPLLF